MQKRGKVWSGLWGEVSEGESADSLKRSSPPPPPPFPNTGYGVQISNFSSPLKCSLIKIWEESELPQETLKLNDSIHKFKHKYTLRGGM